jgi:hypothetical protein
MSAGGQGPNIGAGMRFLKIAVVVMGVLIIAGTTTLVVVIVHRLSVSTASRSAAPVPLDEPAGTRIVALAAVSNGVALALTGGGEADRVVVIDPATGRVVRRIGLGH